MALTSWLEIPNAETKNIRVMYLMEHDLERAGLREGCKRQTR